MKISLVTKDDYNNDMPNIIPSDLLLALLKLSFIRSTRIIRLLKHMKVTDR